MVLELIMPYLPQNEYLRAVALLVIFFIGAKIFVFICQKYILHLTRKTKTEIDDLIVKRTSKPISVFLFLLGLRIALIPLNLGIILGMNVKTILINLTISAIIVIITIIVMIVLDIIIDQWGKNFAKKTQSEVDDNLVALFHKISRIILGIIGFLIVLSAWGVKIGPLLASLGIAGVAVAFALQNSLSNIFGGMSLILDKNIKVGDAIMLDADTKGTIIDVGLRSTKIRTFDNEMLIIPNGKLADSKIINFVLPEPVLRTTVDFGVQYGSNVEEVKKIVLDSIKPIKNIIRTDKEKEPVVMLMEMGDFALKFKLFFWVSTFQERANIKEQATVLVYDALNKAKIGIPFPTRTVYIKNQP